ncbi:MAG: hypothetical protein KCHDKBKB_00665 [Elusimicrobia bacterium]|nr:hypothetical protein [Elusimicrobiota bacterium]
MIYKCYNCQADLPEGDPQTWFCNDECKEKYWKHENVKNPKPKTIPQIQKALAKLRKKVEAADILAGLADNEEYFAAKNIFFPPPPRKIQGLNDD